MELCDGVVIGVDNAWTLRLGRRVCAAPIPKGGGQAEYAHLSRAPVGWFVLVGWFWLPQVC